MEGGRLLSPAGFKALSFFTILLQGCSATELLPYEWVRPCSLYCCVILVLKKKVPLVLPWMKKFCF